MIDHFDNLDTLVNHKDLKVLSINDVLSCCHDDSAGAGILYLHIERLMELVNEINSK